jgi:hypothetical protein
MTKLSKQLRIRLTPEQFRDLADAIIETQKNKSELVRDALNDYLDGNHCRDEKQTKK